MPGTATLGANLLDELVPDIDDIRGEIHPEVGVRQYRVFTVLRSWSGDDRGAGTFTEVESEITPQPLVESLRGTDRLMSAGLDEADVVRLKEISLMYTEAELAGADLEVNQEWVIRLKDAYGQAIRTRDFVLEGSPWPDRVKTIGWVVNLKRSSDAEAP